MEAPPPENKPARRDTVLDTVVLVGAPAMLLTFASRGEDGLFVSLVIVFLGLAVYGLRMVASRL